MKTKVYAILLLSLVLLVAVSGCGVLTQSSDSSNTYYKISAEEAKQMMEEDSNLVILDVRMPSEFSRSHISGAVNIPDTEIRATAPKLIADKNTTILVYCRNGRRSALAAQDLSNLGYLNVYDIGGLFNSGYDIVTE